MLDNPRPLKGLLQFGNHKLPTTTAIFNMGPAETCPSLAKGFCQAFVNGKCICYAMKAERFRPNVLPYRRLQEKFWGAVQAEDFARQLLDVQARKRKKLEAIRFNESGDFGSQDCIVKADKIAMLLQPHNIATYCYTAREDLDFTVARHMNVYGSGFSKAGITGEFKMIEKESDLPKGYTLCKGDCRICKMCLRGVKRIAVLKH